jgi:hypothetical protein
MTSTSKNNDKITCTCVGWNAEVANEHGELLGDNGGVSYVWNNVYLGLHSEKDHSYTSGQVQMNPSGSETGVSVDFVNGAKDPTVTLTVYCQDNSELQASIAVGGGGNFRNDYYFRFHVSACVQLYWAASNDNYIHTTHVSMNLTALFD